MKIGELIYDRKLEILAEKKIVVEDELISFQVIDEEGLFVEVVESCSSDDFEPVERKEWNRRYVPLDYKIQIGIYKPFEDTEHIASRA